MVWPYLAHLLVLLGIYIALAESLDIIVGHAGLLSVTHSFLAGVGAYASALFSIRFSSLFPASLAMGVLAGSLGGLLCGVSSARLRADRFAVATLAFQLIGTSMLSNWMSVTGGPLGLGGIPHPFGSPNVPFLALALGTALFAAFCRGRVSSGAVGRILHGIRDDELFVQSLGYRTARTRCIMMSFTGGLAGLAGAIYAHYISFIDPTTFGFDESILVLSMVLVGGAGRSFGPVLGAGALLFLPEVIRAVGASSSNAPMYRQIAYGIALIFVARLRQGAILPGIRRGTQRA